MASTGLIRRLPSFKALSLVLKKGHNLPRSVKPQMQLISSTLQTICLGKNYRSFTCLSDLGRPSPCSTKPAQQGKRKINKLEHTHTHSHILWKLKNEHRHRSTAGLNLKTSKLLLNDVAKKQNASCIVLSYGLVNHRKTLVNQAISELITNVCLALIHVWSSNAQ